MMKSNIPGCGCDLEAWLGFDIMTEVQRTNNDSAPSTALPENLHNAEVDQATVS